jgi:hypothetical protein
MSNENGLLLTIRISIYRHKVWKPLQAIGGDEREQETDGETVFSAADMSRKEPFTIWREPAAGLQALGSTYDNPLFPPSLLRSLGLPLKIPPSTAISG